MRFDPMLLFSWQRTIDRVPYVLVGVLLFLVKFAIDWTVATQAFGQPWSLQNYLIWPSERALRIFDLSDDQQTFALTMLLISLPFIWAGILLTMHRLRAIGLPPILVLFFFVPLVNLLFFFLLSLLPTRPVLDAVAAPEAEPLRPHRLRQVHERLVGESHWRSGLLALLVTVPLAVLAVVLGANVLESYGFSLFVGAPFSLGMISVLLFGFSRPQPFLPSLAVAMVSASAAGLVVLLVALEGAICLIMAAPIVYALVFLGAVVGYSIQARPWLTQQAATLTLALLILLPGVMAAESAGLAEPEERIVETEVIIDAPPERVWQYVLAFPPLPEPDEWLFRAGVAYPQRAEILGSGKGAVRHCIFSTGTFVEPIEVWEAPRLLRFSVTEQPEPMTEWSPFQIHPPHLDHYLVSRQGEFLLEALPDGRTRLRGSTWYSNRMWPGVYWSLWSDWILHRIHRRVLAHIQELAERPAGTVR
jgi:hypothetical protein